MGTVCLAEVLPEKEKVLDKLELSLAHSRGDGSDLRPGAGSCTRMLPRVPWSLEGAVWTLWGLRSLLGTVPLALMGGN